MLFGSPLRRMANYDEETESEALKLKWLLIAGVAFLVSAYYSYREFKYLVWGKTVAAVVTRTYEHQELSRRGRKKTVRVVEYAFDDENNTNWRERDTVPLKRTITEPLVAVQYLPGERKSSRLEGNSHYFAVWVFLGCVTWLGYSFFRLYQEANEPVRRARPGSRKPRVRDF
ncbi:MAG: hypothetical protein O2955_05360 [Planctomycetota bacterium]|nr:hypothetical protein [Planctomycetota bacterium]MDA1211920.1 hypothetical protein [Planctomycetota bacterium]